MNMDEQETTKEDEGTKPTEQATPGKTKKEELAEREANIAKEEELNEREEELKAKKQLQGEAEAGQEPVKPKEETSEEYSEGVLSGKIKAK